MNKKEILNTVWSVAGFLVAFLVIQFLALLIIGEEPSALALVISTAASSIVTIALFAFCKWSPFSRTYLQSRPWAALIWIVLLACGTIIPSMWLLELLGAEMPEQTQQLFEQLMSRPEGYIAVGILAPVAEEMVFRGAILRTLLTAMNRHYHWVAIMISALLFGAMHGNIAQFVHATLLGLLLGWMYYRTDSIVPGIVLHWVNNTAVFVLYKLLPQSIDCKLVDLFGGNERMVWAALGFSLCILLPSLFQVTLRLRKSSLNANH